MIHQHTKALHESTNIKRLFVMQNKSTEKMKYCLLVYDPTVTLLSTNIFIDSTHLKILSVRNGEISEISVLDEQNLYYWLCECPAATIIRQQVFGN